MAEATIRAADGGSFSGYLAVPASGKGPGILLIQEIFGVNKVMRDLANGFAAQGYTALCPDLFWRQEPGIQITDKTEAEWARAFQLYQGFDEAKGRRRSEGDARASARACRHAPARSARSATVSAASSPISWRRAAMPIAMSAITASASRRRSARPRGSASL